MLVAATTASTKLGIPVQTAGGIVAIRIQKMVGGELHVIDFGYFGSVEPILNADGLIQRISGTLIASLAETVERMVQLLQPAGLPSLGAWVWDRRANIDPMAQVLHQTGLIWQVHSACQCGQSDCYAKSYWATSDARQIANRIEFSPVPRACRLTEMLGCSALWEGQQ